MLTELSLNRAFAISWSIGSEMGMTQGRLKSSLRYTCQILGLRFIDNSNISLSKLNWTYTDLHLSCNLNLLHLCWSHSCRKLCTCTRMGSSSALGCVRSISISWPTYPGLHTSATHCARWTEWHLNHATAETTITMETKTSLAGLQSFCAIRPN